MTTEYRAGAELTPEELAGVFERPGIDRPVRDTERLRKMIAHANLTVTPKPARSLTAAFSPTTFSSYAT